MRTLNWNPVQAQILADSNRQIFGSGGFRSGKSTVFLYKITQLARLMPGSPIIIGRETMKELKKDTYEILFNKKDGLWVGLGNFNKTDNIFEFYNGSKCFFTHFDDESNARGGEAAIIYVEQAEGIKQSVFDTLTSRLSYWTPQRTAQYIKEYSTSPKLLHKPGHFIFVSANPEPKSFLKQMFIEKRPKDWSIYDLPTDVNAKNLEKDYIEKLKAGKSEQWIRRFIENSWETPGGLVYSEFNRFRHVVQPFRFPDSWRRITAIDPGYTHPAGVLFTVLAPDGTLYCYDEIKVTEKTPYEVADLILEKQNKWKMKAHIYLIDFAANAKNKLNGKPEGDIFREKGIPVQNADKSASGADGGRMRTKNAFASDKIKVFAGLTSLIEELGLHIWHPTLPDTVVKTDDDLLDPLRYIVNRTYKPLPLELNREYKDNLDTYVSKVFWQAMKPAQTKPLALFQTKESEFQSFGL